VTQIRVFTSANNGTTSSKAGHAYILV